MENTDQAFEALNDIRSLMRRSSRFLSLSGGAGIAAGIIALLGLSAFYYYLQKNGLAQNFQVHYWLDPSDFKKEVINLLLLDASAVMFSTILISIILTRRKAKALGLKAWDHNTRKVLESLFVPLFSGGVLCIAFLYHGQWAYLPALSLVFYGLALVQASRYTRSDLKLLGIGEIVLGLGASFLLSFSLIFWGIGFGLLHIIYGSLIEFSPES